MIREWFIRRAERKTERVFKKMSPEDKKEWDRLALHGTEREKAQFVGEMLKMYEGRKWWL